ncbi:unnamed protein product [Lepeophtheirus salmonis]|uniref:(salmon louse) hypothetical protein n=1 Tax=Lepeophtheirus salmonis TaxID=72036 RepID=A0A7R8HAK8_LEPSM|nr:unnamed protein product [Lepeophtheirus salmonis]CAF2968448.1 unnamed protein product [Lepeophtheirus salmonis]
MVSILQKIFKNKTTIKLTDGVSHNFGIEEIVALELGTDYLLCHTHPVLMFNPELVNLFREKNLSKLENVPINKLAAERHVGLVHYELFIREAGNLTSPSNSIVKAKSIELIEFKPVDEMKNSVVLYVKMVSL